VPVVSQAQIYGDARLGTFPVICLHILHYTVQLLILSLP